ncbi:MAG: hypothetical protein H8D67_12950 [Deltaproteobacteria bacterium]|nr:hypothetical protein [Deltaproteobacteria bacterium]
MPARPGWGNCPNWIHPENLALRGYLLDITSVLGVEGLINIADSTGIEGIKNPTKIADHKTGLFSVYRSISTACNQNILQITKGL